MDAFDRARDLSAGALGTVSKRGGKALREFKQFVLRGNVVDLAVGVVIGAAFGAIVNSLVKDILTPLLGFLHVPDFKDAFVGVGRHACKAGETLRDAADPRSCFTAKIAYGTFINAIISFVLISATVFFFVVKPMNHLMAKLKTETDVDSPTKECPQCLSKVPGGARRCAFCTSEIGAPA